MENCCDDQRGEDPVVRQGARERDAGGFVIGWRWGRGSVGFGIMVFEDMGMGDGIGDIRWGVWSYGIRIFFWIWIIGNYLRISYYGIVCV